jgi:hypothetical protein
MADTDAILGSVEGGEKLRATAFKLGARFPSRLAARVATPLDSVLASAAIATSIEYFVNEVFVGMERLGIHMCVVRP